MKHLMVFTVGLCLLFVPLPAAADQAADRTAIREAEKIYRDVYNAHDAKAFAATYDDNAENWNGSARGRASIERIYSEFFAGPEKNTQVTLLEEIGIFFVTADVAIYKARYGFSGRLDEEGKALPPSQVLYAKVYVKKDGKWLGAHGYFIRPIGE
jgi:uncharacterized protein (TIGR02246 family)